jgi:transposase
VVRCPHCNSKKLRKKARIQRRVKHESIGLRRVELVVHGHKFLCRDCGRYFNQRFPGIKPYQRATERLKQEVAHYHNEGVSQSSLAKQLHLGKSTVERWYHQCFVKRFVEQGDRHCPTILGIDEHHFSRKQFATTFCDLRKHRVFDVVKGRSEKDLLGYLSQLKGRERVKVVCMDLSSSYRALVQKHFPNAKIVADRFHVLRLLSHQSLQACRKIDPELKYHRGLLAALRTRPERLSDKQRTRRDNYFKKYPAIEAIYEFNQQMHALLMNKHCTAKRCRQKLIPEFLESVEQLKCSGFASLRTLGKTFDQWCDPIVRMWRFTKSNGITEGFHRKMKLIQRRAYGFKNFDNYRLRVRVLCA